MSHSFNLLPSSRRADRKRARRIRMWIIVCACYTGAHLLSGAWLAVTHADTGRQEGTIAEIDQRIDQVNKLLADAQGELREIEPVVAVRETLTARPDWSVLLRMLAARAGAGVALSNCRLQPVASAGRETEPAEDPLRGARAEGFQLNLEGVAVSLADVSSFVLELESIPLFDSVSLRETDRVTALGQPAVRFRIECTLGGKSR